MVVGVAPALSIVGALLELAALVLAGVELNERRSRLKDYKTRPVQIHVMGARSELSTQIVRLTTNGPQATLEDRVDSLERRFEASRASIRAAGRRTLAAARHFTASSAEQPRDTAAQETEGLRQVLVDVTKVGRAWVAVALLVVGHR